ncbi:hypothetical protein D3C76_1651520 [compost metagenome]
MARTDVYYRAYDPMTLDSWSELSRWQPTGVQVPAAPPRDANPDREVTRERIQDQAPTLSGH